MALRHEQVAEETQAEHGAETDKGVDRDDAQQEQYPDESIGDAEVVLKQEDGSKETLKLYPDVEISKSKPKQRTAPAPRPAAAKQ